MPKAKVTLISAGMKELLNDPGVKRMLRAKGEAVAAQGRTTAPVASGEYRDGITVWEDETDRPVVRIGSTARHAPLVEAKTGNLARALDAAGGS